ncbi:hypothetical protein AAFF_G00122980 [Aldrovandia affinis]|uniref:Uncharacterized protein n=1 Tax=Aldrovandia affinis TaxID=143900 RepID=A0AAD7RRW0_9TELE|nr:hypothetical protein AAFF_G00122980 [Aldrovandia affinis]
MEQVAHQTIVMQFILELSKSLKVDPRGCFRQFFAKIKTADQQYQDAFNDELESFKERVRGRAKVRIEKAMKEYEEEERLKRLGPGGLDPAEVYESLPEEMQKCFDEKNIQMLQTVITKLDPTEAKLHMQRCVDSGLWVPNSRTGGGGPRLRGAPERAAGARSQGGKLTPWVTRDIKAIFNAKKRAFRAGNREEVRTIQVDLRVKIREAKEKYRRKLERQLQQNKMRKVWSGRKTITGFRLTGGRGAEGSVDRANEHSGPCPSPP